MTLPLVAHSSHDRSLSRLSFVHISYRLRGLLFADWSGYGCISFSGSSLAFFFFTTVHGESSVVVRMVHAATS